MACLSKHAWHYTNLMMINPLSDVISCSFSTQLITSDSSVILESDIDPGCISLNINPIPFGEISAKAFSRTGELCLDIPERSLLTINFTNKPLGFNAPCLKLVSGRVYVVRNWCRRKDDEICMSYTMNYDSVKVEFRQILVNDKVICSGGIIKTTPKLESGCDALDRSTHTWDKGRNGELCIPVSKYSKLEISFSTRPEEFNPYCFIPSITATQKAAYRLKHWCTSRDGKVCTGYTMRYLNRERVTFASIKEDGRIICDISKSTKAPPVTVSKITTTKKSDLTTVTKAETKKKVTETPKTLKRTAEIKTTKKNIEKPTTRATITTTSSTTKKKLCSPKYNYKEVLHKSLLFYEAQRSGHLPKSNRIPWRKDSMLDDGVTVGHDLSGGYYDAGDYMKFSFPMAATVTLLAWGMVEFSDGYKLAGEYRNGLDAIKWATDYFIKCHTNKDVLWIQVGDGHDDHKYWGRPEQYNKSRPCFAVNKEKPGSDVAGEISAAFSASAIVFQEVNPKYSATLLDHAKLLYDFANSHRGKYTDFILQAKEFYPSWSGYKDELVWATIWLYKATKDDKYLKDAELHWTKLSKNEKNVKEISWDNKVRGSAILLAKATGKNEYLNNAQLFCQWCQSDNSPKTTQGLLFLFKWGANRYAGNVAFGCLVLSSYFPEHKFDNFSRKQIHLLLGDAGRSFVIGFGKNYPTRPHHRSSSCPDYPEVCNWNHYYTLQPNPKILYGALVGGPRNRTGYYEDSRTSYISNEVSLDYNAGFQSAVAGLLSKQKQGDCGKV